MRQVRPYNEFGLNARAIMLQKNICIKDVANHIGVSPAFVSDLFVGARNTEKRKKQIAEYLGFNEKCTTI